MSKIFLLLLFLLLGNNFRELAYAATEQIQIVQSGEQKNTYRFWEWYQKLDENDRMAARDFLRHFLLGERTSSEVLKVFSNNRGQALVLSSFIEQAENDQAMKDLLNCVANEGGSGCAPSH